MTKKFREKKDHVIAPGYQKNILPKCETFERDAFDQMLSQDGCTSVRIYFGMGTDDKIHAIIVGVDKDGHDMVRTSTTSMAMDSTNDIIIENGARCPDDCPPDTGLNI